MLAKLRIGPKLLLAPGVALLLLILLSCGAYCAMVRQNHSLETIVRQRAANLRDTADLVASAHHAHSEMYQLLTWISASFSAARVDALIRDIHQRHSGIERRFSALAKVTGAGSAERRFIEQAETAHGVYVKAILDVIELSQADQSMSANAMSKAERAFDLVALRLGELSRLEQELSEQAWNSAAADFRIISTLMPLVIALSIVLSLAITMAVRRALLREVTEIGDATIDLASGNLMVRPRTYGKDEISETACLLDTSVRNLNATLEGILDSRAGEHGCGFAVVATKVRMLARQSATAAREIRESIALSVAEIDGGSESVAEAGHNMADIATSVQRMGDIISQISHASAEQATGIFEVSQAIVQMDQMTRQNSTLVTEAAAAAASLQQQATSLARAVAGFNLDEATLLPLPPVRVGANGRRNHLRLASKRP